MLISKSSCQWAVAPQRALRVQLVSAVNIEPNGGTGALQFESGAFFSQNCQVGSAGLEQAGVAGRARRGGEPGLEWPSWPICLRRA